jgi:uncharacterized protein (DUF1697 family)
MLDFGMPVIVSLLRGVNLGPHHRMKMDALRTLCESLGLRDPQTYLQSGNVLFRAPARDLARLPEKIEAGIERAFGFRSDVVLRTSSELRGVIERNPFADRRGIDPSRLLITFLRSDPGREARDQALKIECEPEEFWIEGREIYTYFTNGMARPKLKMPQLEKTLGISGTGRNWNTVRQLLDIAEAMET